MPMEQQQRRGQTQKLLRRPLVFGKRINRHSHYYNRVCNTNRITSSRNGNRHQILLRQSKKSIGWYKLNITCLHYHALRMIQRKKQKTSSPKCCTEIPVESIRTCRWNIKRNSCPTIRNGSFQGNGSDSVCSSPTLNSFNDENCNKLNLKVKN